MDPGRFAAMRAKVEAKRAARSPAEAAELNRPRDIFAEVEQERAEARALSLFDSVEAIQEFVKEIEEDAKTGRRFATPEELMEFLDQLCTVDQNSAQIRSQVPALYGPANALRHDP